MTTTETDRLARIYTLSTNILTSLTLPNSRQPPRCYLNDENPPTLPIENLSVKVEDIPQSIMDRLVDLKPMLDKINILSKGGESLMEPVKISLIERKKSILFDPRSVAK